MSPTKVESDDILLFIVLPSLICWISKLTNCSAAKQLNQVYSRDDVGLPDCRSSDYQRSYMILRIIRNKLLFSFMNAVVRNLIDSPVTESSLKNK